MEPTICLCELQPGQGATVCRLDNPPAMRRRLLDLGLLPGTQVVCVGRSPGGDPSAYRICQAVIALRREDSRAVQVCPLKGAGTLWD